MPLGAVELTLLDAAMLYNGLLTGQRTKVEDDSDKGNILIERIEGPAGEVLFEATPQTQQVSNFVSGMLLSNILHNVVEHGTVAGHETSKQRMGLQFLLLERRVPPMGIEMQPLLEWCPKPKPERGS